MPRSRRPMYAPAFGRLDVHVNRFLTLILLAVLSGAATLPAQVPATPPTPAAPQTSPVAEQPGLTPAAPAPAAPAPAAQAPAPPGAAEPVPAPATPAAPLPATPPAAAPAGKGETPPPAVRE